MTISVVTAVRNDAEGTTKALEAVATQADGELQIEHVIVDGASTDSTGVIIDEFVAARTGLQNPRYIVVHEPDRGIYDAMNKGRELASGDFLYFLNAGDELSGADVFCRVADCIRLTGETSALYYGQVRIRSKYASWCRPETLMGLGRVNIHNVHDLPHHQSAFYPRSFYSQNPYDTDFIKYGDTDFSLRCVQRLSCYSIPIRVAEVTLGGFSTKRHAWHELRSIRNDFRRLASKHPEWFSAFAVKVRNVSFCFKWLVDTLLGMDAKHFLIRLNSLVRQRLWGNGDVR